MILPRRVMFKSKRRQVWRNNKNAPQYMKKRKDISGSIQRTVINFQFILKKLKKGSKCFDF